MEWKKWSPFITSKFQINIIVTRVCALFDECVLPDLFKPIHHVQGLNQKWDQILNCSLNLCSHNNTHIFYAIKTKEIDWYS